MVCCGCNRTSICKGCACVKDGRACNNCHLLRLWRCQNTTIEAARQVSVSSHASQTFTRKHSTRSAGATVTTKTTNQPKSQQPTTKPQNHDNTVCCLCTKISTCSTSSSCTCLKNNENCKNCPPTSTPLWSGRYRI